MSWSIAKGITREQREGYYLTMMEQARNRGDEHYKAVCREFCKNDLYFLLLHILGRKDIKDSEKQADFVFDRCREVYDDPDDHIDLWSRGHFKSTIITQAKTIQEILCDPELTFCIFSFTRPIAKGFLRLIKREFETNEKLKVLFPDIFWKKPRAKSPKWSENDGIVVKRKGNPVEATVEAWGLTDVFS